MTQDENDLTFRKNKVDMLCKNSQIEQDYQVPVCATLSVSQKRWVAAYEWGYHSRN